MLGSACVLNAQRAVILYHILFAALRGYAHLFGKAVPVKVNLAFAVLAEIERGGYGVALHAVEGARHNARKRGGQLFVVRVARVPKGIMYAVVLPFNQLTLVLRGVHGGIYAESVALNHYYALRGELIVNAGYVAVLGAGAVGVFLPVIGELHPRKRAADYIIAHVCRVRRRVYVHSGRAEGIGRVHADHGVG